MRTYRKLRFVGLLALLWTFPPRQIGTGFAQETGSPSAAAPASGSQEPFQPDKAKAYYHFALSHLYQEKGTLFHRPDLLARAVEELKLALQHDPTSSFLGTELADLYASTGRWENALQEAEEAIRRNPEDPVARRLLGRLYVRLLTGNQHLRAGTDLQERAIQQFEEIVQRDPSDLSSYLVLAHLYRAAGQNAKAEETLKNAIALQPGSADANTNLALLYMDLGDYRSAIELLEKVRTPESDVQVLGTLAYAYEQVHDYKAAADLYSRALERDPDSLLFRKGLGQSLLFSQQYEAAAEQFQFLIQANPSDAESYLRLSQVHRFQHKYDLARQNLTKALELAPDNLDLLYNQILLAESERNLPEAIRLAQGVLDSAAKSDPSQYAAQEKVNRGVFLEKLGFLYRDQGNLEAAKAAFRQMLDLGNEHAIRGEVRLIEIYQENRDYETALAASEKAMRQHPDSRELTLARTSLLASTGDVEQAVNLLKPLLQNTPEDREIWLALAQVHLRAKQFEPALQAVSQAEEFSETDDEKSYAHFLYGSIWERQKNYAQAEKEFREALRLNPDSAMTLNYLGYMFADQGIRLEEAIRYIQQALETEPNSGAYLDSLGWAYYRQDRLDLAEQYLKKAVERMSTDPTIRDHLGDIYYKSGRIREAQDEWEAALDEWKRLPKNEQDPEEVVKIEKKLKQSHVKLAQEKQESQP